MNTQQDYEQQIIQDTVTNQQSANKVTMFRIGGNVRAAATAIAGLLSDVANDILQFKRSKALDTCPDDQLATSIGNDRGINQNGPSASSVIVVFTGPDTTVIPGGTVVQTSGIAQLISFTTQSEITLGSANPAAVGLKSIGFGNAVLCQSSVTGSQANVPPNTVTVISPAIAGVTCTNPLPARGGTDQETAAAYKERIRNYVNILAQGTQAFYEALAQDNDATVLRAYAAYDPTNLGTKISLLQNSGAAYDSTSLTNAATAISAKQKGTEALTCVNVTMTGVSIAVNVQFDSGVDAATGYANIADALCGFLDWTQWAFGGTVRYSDIADTINNAPGVAYIDLSTLYVNGAQEDVLVSADSLPRLTALSITTIDTNQTVNYTLNQTWAGI